LEEGGAAELLGMPTEAGEARNSGVKQRPWRHARVSAGCAREREQGSEEEREGKKGAVRGVAACLQGISSASRAASKRCRRLGPAQDTQVLEVEDKGYFLENPWLWKVF
jgi:hypothetical protein